MNAEIVATLSAHYPPLANVDELIAQTNELAKLKAQAGKSHHGLEPLIGSLRELLRELVSDQGRIPAHGWKPPPEQDED